MKESTNLKDYVAIVVNNLNATDKNYAFFKSGIELIKVHFSEIVYLQSEHVYVHMITTTGKVLLRAQLKEVGKLSSLK
jgi:DNA-binding LytR/AlgR family response regulator